MDDEQLKAVRTEAAARHAAAAVASAAHAPQAQAVRTCEESQAGVHSVGAAPPRVPEVPPPADSDDDEVVITGEVPASKPSAQALRAAEDDDLASAALARALEREQANEAQKGKRPRVEPQPQRAPAFADGLGFKLSAIRDVQPGDLLTNRNAISLRDIFRVPGNIRWCLASNYLWNLQWLSVALPELFQVPKVFAVMDRRNSDEATIQAAKALGWTVHAPYTPQYGVMHTKLFLIHFQDAQGRQWLRVVVHTGNLVPSDWTNLTEGVWMQDFPGQAPGEGDAPDSPFGRQLALYLGSAYVGGSGAPEATWPGGTVPGLGWVDASFLRRFDFRDAKVKLVFSTPGCFKGDKLRRSGQPSIEDALKKEVFHPRFAERSQLAFQYTSQGAATSAIAEPDRWLNEVRNTFSAGLNAATGRPLGIPTVSEVALVWPTVEEVRTSLDGWAAGDSIPGKRKNVDQQPLKDRRHRWSAAELGRHPEGRQRALPHIKTFVRFKDQHVAWLYLGSHNMTKAALGEGQVPVTKGTNGTTIYSQFYWCVCGGAPRTPLR